MTGYGRGECSVEGFKVAVELSSVNRKQGDIAMSLPRELDLLEPRVREEINRRVSRGRLSVRVTLQAAGGRVAAGRTVDEALARAYLADLRALGKKLGIGDEVTLEMLYKAPGVLHSPNEGVDAESVWPGVEESLKKALDALVRMREREGTHLEKDLKARVKVMRQAAARVRKEAPLVLERYRRLLLERVKAAGVEIQGLTDERLQREIVLFADRSDITEELTRLESHFQQFDDCVKSVEPVGRTLDFLAQEINREVNTIGSKANDGGIAREVVLLKTELEKFREQVQNVE